MLEKRDKKGDRSQRIDSCKEGKSRFQRKESASLEIVKLHQLVITDQREENLVKPIEPEEAIEEEEIEDTEVCLLTFSEDIINDESWLNKKKFRI